MSVSNMPVYEPTTILHDQKWLISMIKKFNNIFHVWTISDRGSYVVTRTANASAMLIAKSPKVLREGCYMAEAHGVIVRIEYGAQAASYIPREFFQSVLDRFHGGAKMLNMYKDTFFDPQVLALFAGPKLTRQEKIALSLRGRSNFVVSIGKFASRSTNASVHMHWIKYAQDIAGWNITGVFMPVFLE